MLWVGRPYESKNVPILLRAIAILMQRGVEVPLLRLVGPDSRQRKHLDDLARKLGVGGNVSIEPSRPYETLPELFARAKLFCYPSTHESFGLPVLEATASAVATVVAELPAFRELHATAVMYCRPNDAVGWAMAIERLITDDDLRRDYEHRGWERSRQYTWQACAEQTVTVYRKLLSGAATERAGTTET